MTDSTPFSGKSSIPDTSQPGVSGEAYGRPSEDALNSADSQGKTLPFSDTYSSRAPTDASPQQNSGSPWRTLANVVMDYDETRVENALKDVESLLRYVSGFIGQSLRFGLTIVFFGLSGGYIFGRINRVSHRVCPEALIGYIPRDSQYLAERLHPRIPHIPRTRH